MTISTTIRNYRKKRRMTQEQLAKRLNISAGAVSKWETGATLPDTELLVSLANELQVSLDELFDFSLKLSEEKLQEIKAEITLSFEKQSFPEGLLIIEKYTKEFPHSEELVFQMAHLIWTYSLLIPFKGEEEVRERRRKAFEYYERLFDSENELMRLNAMYSGAVILMTENRIEDLEALLQKIPSTDYDTFYMSLHVLESKEEYVKARELSLIKLFSRVNEVHSLLAIVGRLYERTDGPEKANSYFDLLEKMEELFQLITPSVAVHRKIRLLMDQAKEKKAAAELKRMVTAMTEQPLNWANHFLFSTIQLSADEEKQKQIRKLYLQEMLTEFSKLEGYDDYEEVKRLISMF